MKSPDHSFQKNVERWAKVSPLGAKIVSDLESANRSDDLVPCQSTSGHPNLKRHTPEGTQYIHDNTDPVAEAEQWFASLYLRNIQVLYVYGPGLGYSFDAARKWLDEDKLHYLVYLEDDANIMRHLLKTERGGEIIHHPQTFVFLIPGIDFVTAMISNLTLYFINMRYAVTGVSSYILHHPEFFKLCTSNITFFSNMHSIWASEHIISFGAYFFKNHVPNFLKMPGSYFGELLTKKFEGVPAIICGAGPSLNKNAHILATLKDRALIFAGGTGMNALNAKGILPHFGAGIDPNPDQYTRLIMNDAYVTPFIYGMRMNPEALQIVHGDKLFFTGNDVFGTWVENKLGMKGVHFEQGFNVLTFCTKLAAEMGCNPIICVGIDLAYSQGDSYASGILSHPIHSRERNFITKNVQEDLIEKPDIYGNPVHTLSKWLAESAWYSDFADRYPHIKLINATQGGIGFSGVENMPLAEVKSRYLSRQYDLNTATHQEIQESPLPETCTKEHIVEVFQEMQKGLKSCDEVFCQLCELYSKESRRKEEEPSNVEKIEGLLKTLDEDEFYKAVFLHFSDAFNIWSSLALKQIELSGEEKSKYEIKQALANGEMFRFKFLREVATLGMRFLEHYLKPSEANSVEETGKIAKLITKAEYPLPSPKMEDIYRYDGLRYDIHDVEMGIEYHEALKTPLDVESLRYPSGAKKRELHRKGDILHGPSTCYREDQTVLAQTWYVNGKREGRVWMYHLDGSLYSLQRYREGEKNGLQQYFYSNGMARAVINYSQGHIHGDVLLFYPDGRFFRQLHYIHGKRDGIEEIWRPNGLLAVEANYKEGLPVGLTRLWHPNGVLAKQILYDESSKRIESQRWDVNGKELGEDIEDYFEQVYKKTEGVVRGLEDVIGNLSKAVPWISGIMKGKEGAEASVLSDEMKSLQEKLQHLRDVEKQFQQQLEKDALSSKEAIWKSSSTKEMLVREVEDMNALMGQEMKLIQESMKDVLEKFKGKKEHPD